MSISSEPRSEPLARSSDRARPKSCFIAAYARIDIEPIRRLLLERKIEAVVPYELPSFGTSVVDTVTSLIDDSDLFIAILEDARYGANIVFELGYAFARGKRILAILSPRYEGLPTDLSSTLYIRAEPHDTEAVAFALDQLVASPPRSPRSHIPVAATGQPIGELADRLLARLHAIRSESDTAGLQQIVSDAVQASGVSVVVAPAQPDLGADLAIWSDDLETWVGNPLLIELKQSIPTVSAARIVYDQVRSYMRATHSGWTLVLYVEGPPDLDRTLPAFPHVLFMSVHDFIEGLRAHSVAEVVRDLRNLVAHAR